MPIDDYKYCSVMINRNILISGNRNRNLWLYSIDINSFSIIPCEFREGARKILINAGRLYLIEWILGTIYESEIGSYTNWRLTRKESTIYSNANQVYCSYNEGYVYIGISEFSYFKFDLNEKRLIALKK
ncbi:unnamed protein product [Blepharisma stoltei]|uniref:Uncharacterized protein n=1 Tax=Blepharisma stoltei TaxID=1481888 RepID=A0AAU9IPL3_9CILI|nr:unnamed protein product [Blepharisma stoltei]